MSQFSNPFVERESQVRCGHCAMRIGSKQACCQPWTYDSELDRCVIKPVKNGEMTIAAIEPSSVENRMLLIMDNGNMYSDYWFDPTQPVLKHLDKVKDIE